MRNILIIDDQYAQLEIVINTIEQNTTGYQLFLALNAETALKIVGKETIDLIITDWEMPDVDGIELIKKLKQIETTKDIPVIMCTGIMTTSENLRIALEAGAVDFIRKPVDAIELIARIHSALKFADSVKKVKWQNDNLLALNTEINQKNNEILNQNEQLQLLNTTKDKFFSIIAHDLRGPFGIIISFADLIAQSEDEPTSDEAKKYFQIIYDTAKNGANLLDNLLQWALSQTQTIEFNPTRIQLKQITNQAIQQLENAAFLKNIKIYNYIDEALAVKADVNLSLAVLRNLLSNAIKFTNVDGEIKIKAYKDKEITRIAIKDNGVGITPERLENLFKLTIKSSTYGTKREKGIGLGLNLCKEFTEIQGGRIWAESEVGKGSTFNFTLPTFQNI